MCQECGFYKGRLVIDMKAKTDARSSRMQAKKDTIKANKTEAEAQDVQAIPGGPEDAPHENMDAGNSKAVETPELPQAKTATPRKGQAS